MVRALPGRWFLATIAGVAARNHLPGKALTIAYATALPESKLENLNYGDRDSIGVFQQRPSQGWGTRTQLEDPAFAAGAFFGALVKVPDYLSLPVYQAAQDVQRSADGSAYEQYAQTGSALTLSLIHISEPTRLGMISYAVFCL